MRKMSGYIFSNAESVRIVDVRNISLYRKCPDCIYVNYVTYNVIINIDRIDLVDLVDVYIILSYKNWSYNESSYRKFYFTYNITQIINNFIRKTPMITIFFIVWVSLKLYLTLNHLKSINCSITSLGIP